MTIFALLFNTLNVSFHNLQSIMEEVLVQLGFQEGWDLQMTRESLEKKHYHDCNLISVCLGRDQVCNIVFAQWLIESPFISKVFRFGQ